MNHKFLSLLNCFKRLTCHYYHYTNPCSYYETHSNRCNFLAVSDSPHEPIYSYYHQKISTIVSDLFVRRSTVHTKLFGGGYQSPKTNSNDIFFLKTKSKSPMGNSSSMLTQYDIEEVQEHCNHACNFNFILVDFLILFAK